MIYTVIGAYFVTPPPLIASGRASIWSGLRWIVRVITNGFYVVTIGIKYESTVIVFMIFWSQIRFAIVFSPSSKSRFVKFVDLFAIVSLKQAKTDYFVSFYFSRVTLIYADFKLRICLSGSIYANSSWYASVSWTRNPAKKARVRMAGMSAMYTTLWISLA